MNGPRKSVSTLRRVLACILLLLLPLETCGCPAICPLCTGSQANCRNLGLNAIPKHFSPRPKLLYLSGNNISSLQQYEFSNLQQLVVLYLDNNGIADIHSKAFAGLTKLYYLYLNNNCIQHLNPGIFQDLIALNYLYMQYNRIAFLPGGLFADLAAVRYLTLQGNHLTVLGRRAFYGMFRLHTLNLANNQISRISDGAFHYLSNLQHLYLDSNNLTQVPSHAFENLTNLKRLSLSGNPIADIHPFAFQGLDGLQYLFLEKAKIKEIGRDAFSGLNNLKHLILSDNDLGAITADMFRFLTHLKYLQLDRNKLNRIDEHAFEHVGRCLKVLNVAHNNLTALQPKVLQPLSSLTHLEASYNPWVCDCTLLGLYSWLRSSSLSVSIHCRNPAKLSGRPLRNIKRPEFEGCVAATTNSNRELEPTAATMTTVMAWVELKTRAFHISQNQDHFRKTIPLTSQTPTASLSDEYIGSNPPKTATDSTVQTPPRLAPANFTNEAKHVFTDDSAPVSLKSMLICQEQFEKLNQAFDILVALFVVACVVIMFLIIKLVQYRQKLRTMENAGDTILEYYSCYQTARYSVTNPVQLPPQNPMRNRNSDQIRLLKQTLPESPAQVILFEHSVL
ncbi:leucine-rich repeat-containing protein 70 isoform X2 [Ambystoma mexicanum]